MVVVKSTDNLFRASRRVNCVCACVCVCVFDFIVYLFFVCLKIKSINNVFVCEWLRYIFAMSNFVYVFVYLATMFHLAFGVRVCTFTLYGVVSPLRVWCKRTCVHTKRDICRPFAPLITICRCASFVTVRSHETQNLSPVRVVSEVLSLSLCKFCRICRATTFGLQRCFIHNHGRNNSLMTCWPVRNAADPCLSVSVCRSFTVYFTPFPMI